MRGRRRIDLAIGIALGIAIGVALVALFVFELSDQTVDAPKLEQGRPPAERPVEP